MQRSCSDRRPGLEQARIQVPCSRPPSQAPSMAPDYLNHDCPRYAPAPRPRRGAGWRRRCCWRGRCSSPGRCTRSCCRRRRWVPARDRMAAMIRYARRHERGCSPWRQGRRLPGPRPTHDAACSRGCGPSKVRRPRRVATDADIAGDACVCLCVCVCVYVCLCVRVCVRVSVSVCV